WIEEEIEEKAKQLVDLTTETMILMKDNYSNKFKTDFKAYYNSQDKVSDAPTRTVIDKITDWSFENKSNTSATTKIADPGVYDTTIVYSWADTTVKIEFTKAEADKQPKEDEKENVLFYLPFDASLQGQSESPDYGTALTGGSDAVYISQDHKALSTGGNTTLTLTYLKDLSDAKTQQGELINISYIASTFKFSPTIPFAFTVTTGENNGVLFDFKPEKYNTLNGKIQWSKFAEGKGNPNGVCNNKQGDTQYSLLQASDKGVFFLPIGISDAQFNLVCANQTATMEIKQDTLFTAKADNLTTESKTVDRTKGNAFNIPLDKINPSTVKHMSLQALAEAIKDSRVCIKVTKTSLELGWNSKYLLPDLQGTLASPVQPVVDEKKTIT
ncbi:hypothetical protein KKE06_00050, partial [Candidatus Micrarchaeota archaeon]|nr:hypothetical protein [Candidatus Micrarchaeota archaeon]MBU1930476.1 hypothetical protein [Candidatus Micrarchaeota archaeon]